MGPSKGNALRRGPEFGTIFGTHFWNHRTHICCSVFTRRSISKSRESANSKILFYRRKPLAKVFSINHSNIQYQLAAYKNSLNQYIKEKHSQQSLALFCSKWGKVQCAARQTAGLGTIQFVIEPFPNTGWAGWEKEFLARHLEREKGCSMRNSITTQPEVGCAS